MSAVAEKNMTFRFPRFATAELLRTVDDVLLFSKSQAGMLTLSEHAFDVLYDVIAPSLRILELRAWTKGIDLLYECDIPDDLVIWSDAAKFRTCLMNLVANAIK